MRTYKDAKAMAKALRETMAAKNVALSHSECLEIIARQFGFKDWNTLAAKIGVQPDYCAIRQAPAEPTPAMEHAHVSCSFCSKSGDEVRRLFEGGCSRPPRAHQNCVFICNECVELCAEVNADQKRSAEEAQCA